MSNKPTPDHEPPSEVGGSDARKHTLPLHLSRRRLLGRTGGAAAVAVSGCVMATGAQSPAAFQNETEPSFDYELDRVPDTPSEPPPREFQALSEQEAAVVEALTARMMPGTEDDPGARQAGVVYYIDFLLSVNHGLWEQTYVQGPWARPYEGETPPDNGDSDTIWVQASEMSRYGYQSRLTPLQVYQIGIEATEQHAQQRFGQGVADLSEDEQDEIVQDLLEENAEGFDQFSPRAFFHTLRRNTAEGMFSDPAYGGNRDLVGWRLVGFPGAQRAYSPADLVREDPPREPQPMSDLPHIHPPIGRPGGDSDDLHPIRDSEDD